MVILNFSHPITPLQIQQIEALLGHHIQEVLDIKINFDNQKPFTTQMDEILQQIPFPPQKLQEIPILVNLPSFTTIAGLLLAGLHGRIGYFPAVIRLRPIIDTLPPQFEIAEILNLQSYREHQREKRFLE